MRLHDTRHGRGSLLFAAGVVPRTVVEILRHSQIAVTMDVYTHVNHEDRREAMKQPARRDYRQKRSSAPS